MHSSQFQGVYFIEGRPATAKVLGPIVVQLGGVIVSGQLKSLDDVKRLMVAKVRTLRGNAVVDFEYGQRSVGFLASIFNRDDVVWYGTGQVALVDPARIG